MTSATGDRVTTVRAFNRFYTGVIGVLREGLLGTPHSLTEARVLFELAQREPTDAADLRRSLDIDAGYLSRVLARFRTDGLATRERSAKDGRRQVIRLTEQGRVAFETLDARSADEIRGLLARLSDEDQRRLVGAMEVIREVLGGCPRRGAYVLRPLRPGDLGWVVHRHGVLYAEEYGWDETFEVLVARIVADYADHRDPRRENAWIADVNGEPAGCVFCMKKNERTAQLRILLVEPGARGMGIGARLVEECIRFAKRAGYEELILWTNDVLEHARRIYQRAGFELVDEEPHHSFGHDLGGQHWSRKL
ncbi:MAG: GNAT family N-acetyltransferase [Nitriliruptorales bacterium]|nr:GNAT family N-acetyltransferase [Nitriliruptorales bacterium]